MIELRQKQAEQLVKTLNALLTIPKEFEEFIDEIKINEEDRNKLLLITYAKFGSVIQPTNKCVVLFSKSPATNKLSIIKMCKEALNTDLVSARDMIEEGRIHCNLLVAQNIVKRLREAGATNIEIRQYYD